MDMMRALAMHKASATVDKDDTVDEAVDPKVAAHLEKYGIGTCTECKEVCCHEDDPRLELRLARYTCTEEGCPWVVCFLCANDSAFEDLHSCKLCGGAYVDTDYEEEWDGEEEDEDEEEEEEEEEKTATTVPAGRGGRGRGGNAGQVSGTKRERTF